MAINDPNYRYATQTFEADGVRTDYEIAFDGGYIRQSDVVAFSVAVDQDTGLVTDRTVHPLTFLAEEVDPDTEWKSATVQIAPAVAAGRRVVIFRSTEKSQGLVNFTARSIITAKNLDLMNDQAVFGIAEIMDGLNAARIDIDSQVQQVIDMNQLIQSIYEEVIRLLSAAGYISTIPRLWHGVAEDGQLTYPIPGADVTEAGLYDVYVNGEGVRPDLDYVIDLDNPNGPSISFTSIAEGDRWFAVLRGYAQPYAGPPPLTTLRWPVRRVDTTSYFITKPDEFAVCPVTTSADCTVFVPIIPTAPVGERFDTGSYMSFTQRGVGTVTVEADDPAVTLVIPAGLKAATRAQGSTISLFCEDRDTNTWIVSGDLATED